MGIPVYKERVRLQFRAEFMDAFNRETSNSG